MRLNSSVDINGYAITPKEALAKLKKAILLSPKRCVVVVRHYLDQDFDPPHTNYSSEYLIPIISGFLVQEDDYEKRKANILCWTASHNQWDFLTEWLEDEMRFSSLAPHHHYLDLFIQIFKVHCRYIYTYKNNFFKGQLLLLLIHNCGWPMPTNKQMTAYDVNLVRAYFLNVGERKAIEYKIACPQLLKKGKHFVYRLQCFHLLTKQRIDEPSSSTAISELQGRIFTHNSYTSRLVSFLSTAYWEQLDDQTFIDGGNVVVDLLYNALLMLWKSSMMWFVLMNVMCVLFMEIVHQLRLVFSDLHIQSIDVDKIS